MRLQRSASHGKSDAETRIPHARRRAARSRLRSLVRRANWKRVLNQGAPGARFAALVCHPHPLGGGNLHNKVVYHAMKVLNDAAWGLGCPVLRFNFRGTGLSEGAHDGVC